MSATAAPDACCGISVKLPASAAALVSVLLLLPAPAAATPRAVDFELAPDDAVVAAAAGRELRSRPLRTRPFDLVGMRWRGRAQPAIEVRVRRTGGWSRWEPLDAHGEHNPDPRRGERSVRATDPLWVGRANAVQYRMDRRVRGLRLHFVRVNRPKRQVRAAQQPDVVSRADWGASACPPRSGPGYGEVKAIHVHHTVSLNNYGPEDGPAMVLAICRYHRNSNGWDDIGYNALVDKYGVLYEGRAGGLDKAVIGAQAQGFNAQTAGIATIGDHTAVAATPQTLDAIARYIRWKLPLHGQPLSGRVSIASAGGSLTRYGTGAVARVERVIGHRDTGRTACPGAALYAQLPALRSLVGTGGPLTPAFGTRLSALLGITSIVHGEAVPLSGTLRAADGTPIAGERVKLQVNSDGRWRTLRRLSTAPDGAFAVEFRPRLRMYVRIRFPGHGGLQRSGSTRLLLHVRPLISIAPPPDRVAARVPVPIRGTVAPRKRLVYLALERLEDGRWRRAGESAVRTRRGRFTAEFTPAGRGRYRFWIVAKPDDDTDRSRLGPFEVRAR